ncbi:hypothetical protein UPYG_G00144530 [Umbra pygmaea]|uniref:Uncharacterized protein n=1 Tax=Umbra pygmaea TaxID=75934 RepID=A0ABD0XIN2_UMBPY
MYSAFRLRYKAGLASKLFLKEGALPTLRGIPADEGHASASLELPATKDIGCQTEPLQRQNVGTQLSSRTLRSHFKSEAVQATVSCMDFGTSTDLFIAPHLSSTPIK